MPRSTAATLTLRPNLTGLFFCLPVLALLLLIPGIALAHVGSHEAGFIAGAGHPISGLDHVLAMVAVGLWAAKTGGRALWAMPLTFVAAMLAGGAIGAAGIPVPGVEPAILASIVVLGAAVALALRPPLAVALTLVAVFAAAHGVAHGAEGPEAGLLPYAAGFALVTAGLHGLGLALGFVLRRWSVATRVLGVLTAGAGAMLALG